MEREGVFACSYALWSATKNENSAANSTPQFAKGVASPDLWVGLVFPDPTTHPRISPCLCTGGRTQAPFPPVFGLLPTLHCTSRLHAGAAFEMVG